MARKSIEKAVENNGDQPIQNEQIGETEEKATIAPEVENLMRLYPNLEKMWITREGFVHPENVPEYLRKGATLYINKYYKQ